jgi:hypothetical protein
MAIPNRHDQSISMKASHPASRETQRSANKEGSIALGSSNRRIVQTVVILELGIWDVCKEISIL